MKVQGIKRNQVVCLIKKEEKEFKTTPYGYCTSMLVDLYPITEDTVIPKEALDPTIWNIPKGYYAIKEDLG